MDQKEKKERKESCVVKEKKYMLVAPDGGWGYAMCVAVAICNSSDVMDQKEKCEKEKRYKLVPPDGGWGYAICMASIINKIVVVAFYPNFGIIYNDLIIELQLGSTIIAALPGINAICSAIAAYLTGALLKITTMRQIVFFTGITQSLSWLMLAFSRGKITFFISQVIFQGSGLGILYTISCAMINDYFVEKRVFILGLVQTVVSTVCMFSALFVKWSLEMYGYPGMMLLITGVSLHVFLAAALTQPVSWHMKKVEIIENPEEMKILLVDEDNKNEEVDVVPTLDCKVENEKEDKPSQGLKAMFATLLDVGLLKECIMSSAILGSAITVALESIFLQTIPQALYSVNWSKSEVAWACTLMWFGDLFFKLLITIFNKQVTKLGSRKVYLFGIMTLIVARLGYFFISNMTVTWITMVLIGIGRCAINVLIPLVIADEICAEKFASTMGIFLLLVGGMAFGLGSVMGTITDLTGNYNISYYAITGLNAIVFIIWYIELWYKRSKRKNLKE